MTKNLLLVLLLSGCELLPPTTVVACAGPAPMTCECVSSCDFSDGGVVLAGVLGKMTTELCVPRCWDRSQ